MVDEDRTSTALAEISTWDDARLVGQLFSVAVGTHSPGGIALGSGPHSRDRIDEVSELVRDRHLGGVCYFPTTAAGDAPDEIRSMVRRLQTASEVPLLISADQENGTVSRLRQGSTRLPSAMALAAVDDDALTEAVAQTSGTELRSVGFMHAFAPVADLNTEPRNPVIGVRSPGASPEHAGRQVAASVRGLARSGVASTLKHFPGHGSTEVDSHLGLPVVTTPYDEWCVQERSTFAAGIAAGADAVMIGHLVFAAVDPGVPATYSRAVVTGELRERLGFTGVIVTDALDMAGADVAEGPGAASVRALAAGVDQILMPPRPGDCIDAVIAALDAGVLSRDELRASARRILRLKHSLGLRGDCVDLTAELGVPAHAQLAAAAARRSMAWRDPEVTWTCAASHEDAERVLVVGHEDDPGMRGVDVAEVLSGSLIARGARVQRLTFDEPVPSWSEVGAVVLATRDAWRSEGEAARIAQYLAAADEGGTPVCAVVTRNPADSILLPASVPVLLTFGDVAPSAQAAADVLVGLHHAPGRLPVDLLDNTGEVRWTRSATTEGAE